MIWPLVLRVRQRQESHIQVHKQCCYYNLNNISVSTLYLTFMYAVTIFILKEVSQIGKTLQNLMTIKAYCVTRSTAAAW